MAKILYLIAPKLFRDEEFFVPYEKFKRVGHDVTVTSTEKVTAQGKLGGSFKIHKGIEDVAANFYKALVIAGGPGSKEYLWPNPKVHQLIKDFSDQNKIVAAICSAAALPAMAGIGKGKKMTCFPGEKEIEHLNQAQALYTQAQVEQDQKLITADGPQAAEAFADKVINSI